MRPAAFRLIPFIWLLLAIPGIANDQRVYSVGTDGSGNVAIAGSFQGTLDLGDGAFSSLGYSDIFVAKFDPDGNPLWSRAFGSDNWDSATASIVDPVDDVLVTGYFHGTVDFGDGPLVGAGNDDIFLVKFDPDGDALWTRRFGDEKNQYSSRMALDASGNVLVAGHFDGTVDFGTGPLTSDASTGIFLVKFDPDGNALWSREFAGADYQAVGGLAVDKQGNVIFAGAFADTVDFGGGPRASRGTLDFFIAKLDADGNYMWDRIAGDANYQDCTCIALDAAGDIFAGGRYYGVLDFGIGSLVGQGNVDAYLVKFDPDGHALWDHGFGTEAYEFVSSLAVDGSDLLVTGFFYGTLDLGGGPLVNTGRDDLFLASFDADGNHLWSRNYENVISDYGSAITVDDSGQFFVGAGFHGTVDLGAGPAAGVSKGGFVAKWDPSGYLDWDRILGAPPLPPRTSLGPNFPNPFSPSTTIQYSLKAQAGVVVDIFDATGRLVARLDQGVHERGIHHATWDGRDDRGRAVESGVYFYRLENAGGSPSGKMILLR